MALQGTWVITLPPLRGLAAVGAMRLQGLRSPLGSLHRLPKICRPLPGATTTPSASKTYLSLCVFVSVSHAWAPPDGHKGRTLPVAVAPIFFN